MDYEPYVLAGSSQPGSTLDPTLTPPELKKEVKLSALPFPSTNLSISDMVPIPSTALIWMVQGSDWFAVFNKHIPRRRIDIDAMHTWKHESVVCCVKFSANGKYLATGCRLTSQIFDVATGERTCVLIDTTVADTDIYIRTLSFSPDGKYLATGAEDMKIRAQIWDIADKRIYKVFSGHQREIHSLVFSHDGRVLVSGSGDRTARIWDMETGRHKALVIASPTGIESAVACVAISPDGQLIATGCLDSIIRLWGVESGLLIDRLMGHEDSVYSVAFTPNGTELVTGSLDKTLKHWDLRPLLEHPRKNVPLQQPLDTAGMKKTSQQSEKGCLCITDIGSHWNYVLSVAVSRDGRWIASGSKDRCVQFWDLYAAQAQFMLQGHGNSVISLDFSPTEGILATGGGDSVTRIWKYTTL